MRSRPDGPRLALLPLTWSRICTLVQDVSRESLDDEWQGGKERMVAGKETSLRQLEFDVSGRSSGFPCYWLALPHG